MKIKLDENFPTGFGDIFRSVGFEADSVFEERLSGAADESVLARSRAEDRVLITLDLDFSNIQAYPPAGLPGIIVLRTKTQDRPTLEALIRRLVSVLELRSPRDQLWIVEQDRIRFRQG